MRAEFIMTAHQHSSADPRAMEVTATGKIRSALFLPQHSSDPVTGELRGHGTGYIGIEITRLLAARLGVESEILPMQTPSAVMDALLACEIDFAFFGIEPGRAVKVDFTPPVFCFDYTYLVPEGSQIAEIAHADQKAVRIVIIDNHASALALRPLIKQATLVSAELPDEAFEILRAGDADAFACPRDVLLDYAAKLPGSRVLDGAFGVNHVGIAINKGQPELCKYISAFVEEAKANGVITRTIERGQLRGFSVAV